MVCPLNWGLGHATRDVQIIEELLNAGFTVIIGADNAPLSFLKQQFPELKYIKLPSFEISYPAKGSMALKMFFSIPKIIVGIIKEHLLLKKIIKDFKIEIIISDNRFGLWNKKIYCVFISHQIWIKTPFKIKFIEMLLNKMNHWFIKQYDACWIPDFEGINNLSNELSHSPNLPRNAEYIGILSRFKFQKEMNHEIKNSNSKYDILVILSGPEPQRSIFENILVNQISTSTYKTLFVLGKPTEKMDYTKNNIHFVHHLPTQNLETLIIETPVIVSRSGYSTIMDLVVLNKTAILVPTPGQTEQEYLAKMMLEKKWFFSVFQNQFNLETAIKQLPQYKPPVFNHPNNLLKSQINKLLFI